MHTLYISHEKYLQFQTSKILNLIYEAKEKKLCVRFIYIDLTNYYE